MRIRNHNQKLSPVVRITSLRGSHPPNPTHPQYRPKGFRLFGWRPGQGWSKWFGFGDTAKQFAQGFDPRTVQGDVAILSMFSEDPQIPALNAEEAALRASARNTPRLGSRPSFDPYVRVGKAVRAMDTRETFKGTRDIANRTVGVQPATIVVHPVQKRSVVNRRNL